MAHGAVVQTLDNVDAVAELGMEKEVAAVRESFADVWQERREGKADEKP
jgi:hypothetical protein